MGALLFLATIAPLLLLLLLALPTLRPLALRAAPWAALPALLAAVFIPTDTGMATPWLFLGGAFTLDLLAKGFLAITAAMWLAAGIYARGYLASNHDTRQLSFFAFFLGTMGGNLSLIPAQDIASYIAFFAIMGFCAYGLIVHERSPANLFAGKIYIAMTIAGEVAAFAGLAWAATLAGGEVGFADAMGALALRPERGVILVLLFVGFGIKLGVMPLHLWLPLAHPAAPTPASAVLSGVMIKTGLLLWLRVFPFDAAVTVNGGGLIAVGLFTTLAAALIGMTQTHPKALLAYSSISQMGLAAIAVGAGLLINSGASAILGVILIFVAHHAIAKTALFLGVGIAACDLTPARRGALIAGMAIAGGALAGLPFTSGGAAKAGIKTLAGLTGTTWTPLLDWILPLTGLTTMLLVVRFLFLVAPRPAEAHGRPNASMILPWAALTLAVPALPVMVLAMGWAWPKEIGLYPQGVFTAAWPPLLAVALAFAVWKDIPVRARLASVRIPAGDILFPMLWAADVARRALRVIVLRPSLWIRRLPAQVVAVLDEICTAIVQGIARYESFAFGILLMTLIAIGMAFFLTA